MVFVQNSSFVQLELLLSCCALKLPSLYSTYFEVFRIKQKNSRYFINHKHELALFYHNFVNSFYKVVDFESLVKKILNFVGSKEFFLKFVFLVLTNEKTTRFFNFLSDDFAVSQRSFVFFLVFVFKRFKKTDRLKFESFFNKFWNILNVTDFGPHWITLEKFIE